jgi:hypothetical protein
VKFDYPTRCLSRIMIFLSVIFPPYDPISRLTFISAIKVANGNKGPTILVCQYYNIIIYYGQNPSKTLPLAFVIFELYKTNFVQIVLVKTLPDYDLFDFCQFCIGKNWF